MPLDAVLKYPTTITLLFSPDCYIYNSSLWKDQRSDLPKCCTRLQYYWTGSDMKWGAIRVTCAVNHDISP